MEEIKTILQDKDTMEFDIEEQEDLDNEIADLKEPFDPKQIDIQIQQTTMDNLIKRLKHDEIDLNPDFQRTANLWKNEIQCRLIESLLIKLPIPAFYFDASIDEKWVVVDGLQRLSTIKKFVVDNALKLKGLEFIKELDTKKYSDLPRAYQRRIEEAPVTLYLIKPGTPKNVKYSLFYRINTGGLILNPQEIRHALSQNANNGQASIFLSSIADAEYFKECVMASSRRMLDKELILRFVSFRLTDFNQYREPMIKHLNNTMETLGTLDQQVLDTLKNDFKNAVMLSWELFGADAFRKSLAKKESKKMINRALFEVVTTVFSLLPYDEREILKARKEKSVQKFINLLNNIEFYNAITVSTTYSDNVKLRFNKVNEVVQSIVKEA
ncbi:DUF262 domain-containing protein [Desulfobacula toluolica]|uniref:Conserved uncharacterized protein, DUF262 n=1 Tax=Desulfobacula toluolica (strain DSM 7467 / Tol2) TaxID=651182 RepID=K0NI29_DESTT|nr:DUF262 domain-containing protein [Desulfobacula toluolica]CCK81021.1 conserved uncharacterized protein, DUF262 [Desulfobacula toluolica Tol2]